MFSVMIYFYWLLYWCEVFLGDCNACIFEYLKFEEKKLSEIMILNNDN